MEFIESFQRQFFFFLNMQIPTYKSMVYKETKQNKSSATHYKGLLTPLVAGHALSFICGLKH